MLDSSQFIYNSSPRKYDTSVSNDQKNVAIRSSTFLRDLVYFFALFHFFDRFGNARWDILAFRKENPLPFSAASTHKKRKMTKLYRLSLLSLLFDAVTPAVESKHALKVRRPQIGVRLNP